MFINWLLQEVWQHSKSWHLLSWQEHFFSAKFPPVYLSPASHQKHSTQHFLHFVRFMLNTIIVSVCQMWKCMLKTKYFMNKLLVFNHEIFGLRCLVEFGQISLFSVKGQYHNDVPLLTKRHFLHPGTGLEIRLHDTGAETLFWIYSDHSPDIFVA